MRALVLSDTSFPRDAPVQTAVQFGVFALDQEPLRTSEKGFRCGVRRADLAVLGESAECKKTLSPAQPLRLCSETNSRHFAFASAISYLISNCASLRGARRDAV